ncbi:MAG: c-type cytochrome [Akkermansiaceae bacterium]|jgi:mono/diheme cytochrome c family protein|nr:c-type cytochrome [Akkermansiaceae bacterium]MDP4721355.1 c-type cytochrome [Akkermansiaceae bacterium]MDP4779424.1 c-type cytochrome [Akkermansiaceae bacterium]MDP4846764.1 c-type cytochrome [Akkermansiaceae bacterium]MDP4897101.1 c-type cytochrome [Akkermansiaceae bacterium]
MIHRLFLLLAVASPLSAQDGEQLYTLYCSACHGADGKGATGGAFPPLAKSPWLKGDGQRAIKVVLNGLEGPIQVLGKDYNLAMPPQGALLPDDQLAAILTYVRSAWGNNESAITPNLVKSVRAASTDRTKPWTPEEILMEHPLPLEVTALKNITSSVFSGSWTELPDFSTLKPDSVEEEQFGIISAEQSPKEVHFAIVWEGQFIANAPPASTKKAGAPYTFALDADDSARVFIDGELLVEVTGIGPMGSKRAKTEEIWLTQGSYPIRIEYLQVNGKKGISLGWKSGRKNQNKTWNWLSEIKGDSGPIWPSIPIKPTAEHTAMYRNFIAGTTPRAIGFGFPGGVNLAYSADRLTTELIWTGPFMDGGHHWYQRGQGNEPPAGKNVIKLSNSPALPAGAQFKGYKLDDAGNPSFSAMIGDSLLTDAWLPAPNGLTRKFSLSGQGSDPVDILITDLLHPQPAGTNLYDLANNLLLQLEGVNLQTKNSKSFISLTPGQSATLTYTWKK